MRRHHIGVAVSSMGKAIAFYEESLFWQEQLHCHSKKQVSSGDALE